MSNIFNRTIAWGHFYVKKGACSDYPHHGSVRTIIDMPSRSAYKIRRLASRVAMMQFRWVLGSVLLIVPAGLLTSPVEAARLWAAVHESASATGRFISVNLDGSDLQTVLEVPDTQVEGFAVT